MEPAVLFSRPGAWQLVLSALLQRHVQATQILGFLPAAAFTSPARQEIFRAIHRLSAAGRPVDFLTVRWDLATHAATTAVLSPSTAQPSQVSGGYIDQLVRADTSGPSFPLRAAHELTAQLQRRESLGLQPGIAGQPTAPGNTPQPGQPRAQASPAPPSRPPYPSAPASQPGPEQRR